MRNRLEVVDLKALDLNDGSIYLADGKLDGYKVSVHADATPWVGVSMGIAWVDLSPEAALELAKHLELAVQALRREMGHD